MTLDEALDDNLDAHKDALDDSLEADWFNRAKCQELAHIWAIILALSTKISKFDAWIANISTPLLCLSWRYKSPVW